MKTGKPSETAIIVCMARAAAHGRTDVPRFDDPTALSLLPEHARRRVERYRAGRPPKGIRESGERVFLSKRAEMMALRTVGIDEAMRAARTPQVVILGAGLDGRAWRMPELADSVVFEVDHPDSQRIKRERATTLQAKARDVRFVPVDFTRDRLDAALAAAGHDIAAPTTWVWEGVVMYLTLPQIEATLEVIHRLSAPRSRLIICYMQPAFTLVRFLVSLAVRRVGEPLRSTFREPQMQALLSTHDFAVVADDDLPAVARALGVSTAGSGRQFDHLRIVTADRG